jgi:hypothetical protein
MVDLNIMTTTKKDRIRSFLSGAVKASKRRTLRTLRLIKQMGLPAGVIMLAALTWVHTSYAQSLAAEKLLAESQLTDASTWVADAKQVPVYAFEGHVRVDPSRASVGHNVTVLGKDFASNVKLDLVWHTVKGTWDIRGSYREAYHGRIFKPMQYPIAKVQTDDEGSFKATFTVPEDYGFNHNITVERGAEVLNRVGFDIEPSASIEPISGPVGTPITITMTGIGWQNMENSWTLMYDNKYVGLLTAVTTRGTAKVVIPATNGPGRHILRIIHGAFQYPYLNTEQNPRPDQPVITMEFTITDGPPVLPLPVEKQVLPIVDGTPPTADIAGPVLWVGPKVAPINTKATIFGKGFTPEQKVKFLWYRVVGNRISGTGWDETSIELGSAMVQPDGKLSLPFAVPDDLGGGHRIEAFANEVKVAATELIITPSALPLDVSTGPVGTQITFHIKGVGWTETANIYHLVYDNAYLGYACGFNSQGDVKIHLPLTGQKGWHFIDIYPGIYKGKEIRGVRNFRVPQLTFERDHPGERLPGFRFAVYAEK